MKPPYALFANKKVLLITKWILVFWFSVMSVQSFSNTNSDEFYSVNGFKNNIQEDIYLKLINELRCPKCQNQNLAGSNSVISKNMKFKIQELVKQGHDKDYIKQYMIERYGDFISYQPPMTKQTSILWVFPPLFLALLIFIWILKLYSKNKTNPIDDEVASEINTKEN